MRRLGLLARIAFICNLAFLVCLLLQQTAPSGQSTMISLVAILGLMLGMGIANPLSNILNGLVLLRKQSLFTVVPKWLYFANLFFLLLQILYLLHTWS